MPGACDDASPAGHVDREAARADGDRGGRVLLPVDRATPDLAVHRWTEPVLRQLAAATGTRSPIVVPVPGQRIDVLHPPEVDHGWSAVGWADATRGQAGTPATPGRNDPRGDPAACCCDPP